MSVISNSSTTNKEFSGYRSIFHFIWSWAQFTHGNKTLYTLLVKYYNDFLDRQSCGRSRSVVTGDILQSWRLSTKKLHVWIFLVEIVKLSINTIQSLTISTRNILADFFLEKKSLTLKYVSTPQLCLSRYRAQFHFHILLCCHCSVLL